MKSMGANFRRLIRRSTLLIGLAMALLIQSVQPIEAQSPDPVTDVEAALATAETVRVIVALRGPELGTDVGIQMVEIEQTQTEILADLPDEDFSLLHPYQTIPGLVGEVTAEGLDSLRHHPDVEAVALDLPVTNALSESVSLIGADVVWNVLGLTGAGVKVAVLDTGIDVSHPDLADNLVVQKCFNRRACPPDNTDEGDNAEDRNGHGTHITGIITGRGEQSPRGVAPDAGIVAVRVLGSNGSGFTSDVLAGLDWVVANQARYDIKVINLSLGGGAYSDMCDEIDANTRLYAGAVRAAGEAGITIFAASGNGGLIDKIMTPACISGVISVGSTYDADLGAFTMGSVCTDQQATVDQVTCASNSSPVLDLLAPGAAIVSTGLNGGQSTKSGTSMSTAHASAVAALMLQARPDLTPAEIETILEETGVLITDGRNGRVTPRLDALAALMRVTGNELNTISGTVRLQGRTNHNGARLFLGQAPCSTTLPEAPVATTKSDGSFKVTMLIGQNDQCLYAVQNGYLVGQYSLPVGDLGAITLPGGDINGDNIINIFDLTFMAARFDSNDPAADINADGLVDIFDLVIAAGNYDRVGPVSIWELP